MNLATIYDVFHQWVDALGAQQIAAQHTHSFDAMPDGLVVTTIFTSARLDPEQRTRAGGRRQSGDRPLARAQYMVAVSGADQPLQAEQALLNLLVEVNRHPEMQLLSDPVPASWWLAHKVAPRPAFQLEVCVTEPVQMATAPLVKEHSLDMSALSGKL